MLGRVTVIGCGLIGTDGKPCAPASFIAVAERRGLIGEVTNAILTQSLQACRRWRTQRPDCWRAVRSASRR